MTEIATFTNEQLIAVCRSDVAEMSKFLKEGEFSNPSRAALYLRITEIALAALIAEPVFARDQVRREHAEWSQTTFGNVGPIGPLKHLSKEALEAADEPEDLSEWADMQFLLWDAQRRADFTDEQITQAMIEKLAVNKLREWPEPKDGEPLLHIKEQPTPAVPEEKPIPNHLSRHVIDAVAAIAEMKSRNASRALLQELKKIAGVSNNCRSNEMVQVVQGESRCSIKAAPTLDSSPKTPESRCSNFPVIPDRWIPVSERIPEGSEEVLCAKEFDGPGDWRKKVGYWLAGKWTVYGASWTPTHWMPLPAAPQEVK